MENKDKEIRYRLISWDTVLKLMQAFSNYEEAHALYEQLVSFTEGVHRANRNLETIALIDAKSLDEVLSRELSIEMGMIAIFADFIRMNMDVIHELIKNLDIYEGTKEEMNNKLQLNDMEIQECDNYISRVVNGFNYEYNREEKLNKLFLKAKDSPEKFMEEMNGEEDERV